MVVGSGVATQEFGSSVVIILLMVRLADTGQEEGVRSQTEEMEQVPCRYYRRDVWIWPLGGVGRDAGFGPISGHCFPGDHQVSTLLAGNHFPPFTPRCLLLSGRGVGVSLEARRQPHCQIVAR